ncbi:M42 family metallopeptidase [Clostridium sp. J1101437_171009_A5]|uniref:M42 family metallopeptidase n=1 Tax=Clostridium sp. J1101437_171009_A5 TaxID=2787098 RepID=UPI001899F27A|nr:M42 family metallopeptidase [Clostridium sp. J1101437_171009_A5]
MDIVKIIETLNACHAPSGNEREIAQAIQTLAAPYADDISVDTLGNVIVHRKGIGPKVMFAAHMDSIGGIVTHVDEKGFVRFGAIGGLHAPDLAATPVRFQNGTRGVLCVPESADPKELKLDDLYVDIGACDEAEARSQVTLGDTFVYDTASFVAGKRMVAPYMDNHISCAVLLLALEQLQKSENDLYFVFTVQEEVGLRGAKTAAFAIDPAYAIAVDVTSADDELGSKHTATSKLGAGAAVKVMDRSVLCHPSMVRKLNALAKEQGIPVQGDIIKAGGTDAGAIHQSRAGVYTGGISIPCRYIHTPQEMVDLRDVEACAKLSAAFAGAALEG